MNYLTELEMILWYIGLRLDKCSDYLTGFELVLLYIGLRLEKHLY